MINQAAKTHAQKADQNRDKWALRSNLHNNYQERGRARVNNTALEQALAATRYLERLGSANVPCQDIQSKHKPLT